MMMQHKLPQPNQRMPMHSAHSQQGTSASMSAHRTASALVYHAVCAEAIRVVFALHALSRESVEHLTTELRCCSNAALTAAGEAATLPEIDYAAAEHNRHPLWADTSRSPATTYLANHFVDSSSLPPSRAEALSHSAASDSASTTILSSSGAHGVLRRASIIGLLTAAHLLRCSAWTAELLCPAASTPLSTVSREARALEELRTSEAGWCATALVRLTEWLLAHDVTTTTRASLLSALSTSAYDGASDTAVVTGPVLTTSRPNLSDSLLTAYTPSGEFSMSRGFEQRLRVQAVYVEDTVSQLFPWLCSSRGVSNRKVAQRSEEEEDGALPCCCPHLWFRGELPRWCVRVALTEAARQHRREHLLQTSFARWRTRRGLRMMVYLSNVAKETEEAPSNVGSADDAASCKPTPTRKGEDKHDDGEAKATSQSQVTERSLQESRAADSPRSRSLNVGDVDKSHQREKSSATPPLADQHTPSSLVLSPPCALREVSLLDRVLQAQSSRGSSLDRTADAGDQHSREDVLSPSPSSNTAPRGSSTVVEGTSVATPPRQVYRRDATTASSESRLTQETEEERISGFQKQRSRAVLQRAFLHWRNRRLYESMATRYVCNRHAESLLLCCWAVWRSRHAVVRQRQKEARDEHLGDMATEQKAVQYFRRLLQRWRRAALAKRFLTQTVGSRALQAWRCRASLHRYQRTSGQRFVGAQRLKAAVWQRWGDRQREATADRHRAHVVLTATFARMRACVKKHQALRAAAQSRSAALARFVWLRWHSRHAQAVQLRASRLLASSTTSVVTRAWVRWESRWKERCDTRRRLAQAREFHEQRRLVYCLHAWSARFATELRVRAFACRFHRSLLLKPCFVRWRTRAELRAVVRRGQEEVAWRVGDQLRCRKVLRVWQRRAAEHAASRQAARVAESVNVADSMARLNALARAFYHWRTRGFVKRRYDVDHRRCLPVPRRLAGSVITASRVGRTELEPAETDSAASDCQESVPTSPRASRDAARMSKANSQRSVKVRRRDASLQGSVGRVPTARIFPHASSSQPERRAHGARTIASAAQPPSAPPQRVSLTAYSPRRSLHLEWQLFVVQKQTSLAHFGVRLPMTHSHSSPVVAALAPQAPDLHNTAAAAKQQAAARANRHHVDSSKRIGKPTRTIPEMTAKVPRWTPAAALDTSVQSSASGGASERENQLPVRSQTATPLFTRNDTLAGSPEHQSPPQQQHPAYTLSDLVESPPQLFPRSRDDRQVHSRRQDHETASSASYLPASSSSSAARLLGRMEQLLQRVRGIEADYRTPPVLPSSRA